MPRLIRFSSYLFIRQDQSRNPEAGHFIPISPPEGEVDFPILKDKIRSLALPTSPTSVASLVAGVLFVLAIGSKRDSDSKLGFLFWNESVLKKDLPILKRGWFSFLIAWRSPVWVPLTLGIASFHPRGGRIVISQRRKLFVLRYSSLFSEKSHIHIIKISKSW